MSTILEELHAMLSIQAESRNIRMDINGASIPDRTLIGDCVKLKQILSNVIVNAIKFTPEGGRITLTAEEKAPNGKGEILYLFECRDNGIGMTKEFMKTMFQPFSRSVEADKMQISGTGLGLSVIKGLVDLMHGTIDVDSQKGKGSVFRIILPFPEEPDIKEESSAESESQEEPKDSAALLQGKRVLVTEDNELNLEITEQFLEIMGIESSLPVTVPRQWICSPPPRQVPLMPFSWISRCPKWTGMRPQKPSGAFPGKMPPQFPLSPSQRTHSGRTWNGHFPAV